MMSGYKKIFNACIILITFLQFSILYPNAQSEEEEYSLKALYIKKINNYIEWPDWKARDNSSEYFKIGVIGKSPIYKTLKKIYIDQKLFNKNVDVIKVRSIEDISSYNILFVSNISHNEIISIIDVSKKNNILLISDTKGFALSGIHINFYIKNNKLKFEINRNSLLHSGLSASSFLLSLAKIVNTKGDYK